MFNSALAAISAAASLSSSNLLQEHSFPDRRLPKFEQPGQSEAAIFWHSRPIKYRINSIAYQI
jgi:hypothetical protein